MPIKLYQTPPNSPLAFSEIQTEFGGTDPISLSEYYAGGGRVPSGTQGFPSAGPGTLIPSAGAIAVNNFYGSQALIPITVTVTISPSAATAEGAQYTVQLTDSQVPPRAQLWWSLGSYTNLDASDFSLAQGTVTSSGGVFPQFSFNSLVDSTYEDLGSFRVLVYADAPRTQLVGQSNLITVTDTWSSVATAWSSAGIAGATRIYRYANLRPLRSSASMTFSAVGLRGATIYWEILIDGLVGSGSADLNQPGGAFTGTTIMPASDSFNIDVQSRLWDGFTAVTADRTITVRFRFNNSSGQLLATSLPLTLGRTPELVTSGGGTVMGFSPTTIAAGEQTYLAIRTRGMYHSSDTVAGVANPVADIAWTTNNIMGQDLNFGGTQGTFPQNADETGDYLQAAFYTAFLDSDPAKTVNVQWRINGVSGTIIRTDSVTINPPSALTSSNFTARRTNQQVVNLQPYALGSRTWTARARITGGSGWFSTKTLTVPANQTFSDSQSTDLPDAGGNPVGHSVDYEFVSSNSYPTYSETNTQSSFTWPIDSFTVTVGGVNALGQARWLAATIVCNTTYPQARVVPLYFSWRLTGSGSYSDWVMIPFPGPTATVTIPANSTGISNVIFYNNPQSTVSVAQDFRFRICLGPANHSQQLLGHQVLQTGDFIGQFLV